MEQLQMPQSLLKNMTYHSDLCHKHTYIKGGQEVVKPIQKMIIDDQIVCPRCESEKNSKELQSRLQEEYDEYIAKENYNVFFQKSIIEDETLLNATLSNYQVVKTEEKENKRVLLDCVKRLADGEIFNVVLQGNQGAGKSHLAYAALRELNETNTKATCLFVNVESMIRKIKDSFDNKESKYSERYFVELMSRVTYLVLDDIGAETGAIHTEKSASDFVQRILYAITTTRQNKSTFITTNLPSDQLFRLYDKKLVSRMLKRPKFIIFKETNDKRLMNLPF